MLLKESHLKILQLESDIKLKEIKLGLLQLQSQNKCDEYAESIRTLQEQVGRIQREKREMAQLKEDIIATLRAEVNGLEQQLIQAKLDAATVKSQLQEEKNRALILRK
jgi:hypothetical protein